MINTGCSGSERDTRVNNAGDLEAFFYACCMGSCIDSFDSEHDLNQLTATNPMCLKELSDYIYGCFQK